MLTYAKHIVMCLVFYDVQSRTNLIGHNKTPSYLWISGDDLMVVDWILFKGVWLVSLMAMKYYFVWPHPIGKLV